MARHRAAAVKGLVSTGCPSSECAPRGIDSVACRLSLNDEVSMLVNEALHQRSLSTQNDVRNYGNFGRIRPVLSCQIGDKTGLTAPASEGTCSANR